MQAPRRRASIVLAATAVMAGSAIWGGAAVAQDTDLGPATGEVPILMIGWPDQDGIDPDGNPRVGIGYVEQLFEAAHPDIDLKIVNIPWGSGSTGCGPKTESMIQANEAHLPHAGLLRLRATGKLQDLDVLIARIPPSRTSTKATSSRTRRGCRTTRTRPRTCPTHGRPRHPLGLQAVRGRVGVELSAQPPWRRSPRRPRP